MILDKGYLKGFLFFCFFGGLSVSGEVRTHNQLETGPNLSGGHRVAPSCSDKTEDEDKFKNDPFMFSFMGKADRVPWDIGVLKAAYSLSSKLKSGDVIYGGNSSGSLLAAYFGCWGISKESIERAETIINEYDYTLLNLNAASKTKKIFAGRVFGAAMKLEENHDELEKLINLILHKDGRPCSIQKGPLQKGIMISAANLDVLDSRVYDQGKAPKVPIWAADQSEADSEAPFYLPKIKTGLKDNEVNLDNFNVTKNGKVIGKACTYFVTPDLYEQLKRLDVNKRQCDLRLIENYDDLKLAMHASLAEPTFFDPVVETAPQKILEGVIRPETRRVYVGGYLVSPLGRDLKRVNPKTYVLGTGVQAFPNAIDSLISSWYTLSANTSLEIQKKDLDTEVIGDWAWDSENPIPSELAKAGYEKAKLVLEPLVKQCLLP